MRRAERSYWYFICQRKVYTFHLINGVPIDINTVSLLVSIDISLNSFLLVSIDINTVSLLVSIDISLNRYQHGVIISLKDSPDFISTCTD
jgi:hypothetical protein